MIVRKIWTTGYRYSIREPQKSWIGYFLFGIIPLYIKQVE